MSAEPRASCPPDEQLACFIDGSLPPSAVATLELHLALCDRCCSIVAAVPDDADADVLDGELTEGHDRTRAPLDGHKVGRYVMLERVGSGGMGVVWAAYDPELDRRVAIKLLHYDATGSRGEKARRRLVHEARAMARVAHPNIVAVHDVVEVDDRVFMIMELVTGRTLGAWLREEARGWREIVEFFIAAGHGLAAAHDQGVVHRDFKPDNVLVGADRRVRVGDFGLASTDTHTSRLPSFDGDPGDTVAARTAGFVGTPAYMAPEQFAGDPVDARTDQFAFCIALWEALFGKRPFAGNSVTALAAAVADGDVAAPPNRRRVPVRIERAVRRGLAREPSERHPDLRSLLSELERGVHGRRTRIVLGTAAVAVAALVGAAAWPRSDTCGNTPEWIDAGWSASRREALRANAATQGEAAIDLAARVTDVIDARITTMTDAFAASCRATFVEHAERIEDHDLRLSCLRRSAAAVEEVAGFAIEANARGLAGSLQSMTGLTARCDDLKAVAADVPWTSAVVDRERALRLSVAAERASTLRMLGDVEAARALLAEPLEALDEPGLGRLAAFTVFERGMLEQRSGHGAEDIHLALKLAAEHDNASVIYSALNQLVFEAGVRGNDPKAAEAYAEVALAFVGRSQLGSEAEGTVLLALAQTRERAGDKAGARKALTEARAAFERADVHTTERRFPMYMLLGLLDEQDGKLAAAEAQYEHVQTVIGKRFGPFHPDLAVALEYLTIVRRKRGAYDLALAAAERALEIRRALLGKGHIEVAASLGGRANVLLELGRYDEAEQGFEEALAMWRAHPGMDRQVAVIKRSLGDVALRRGDPERALALYGEALAIAEPVLGKQHPELALALLGIGESERALGRTEAAVPVLERAHGLLAHDDAGPLDRAEVELALARALFERDEARARKLAEQARDHAKQAAEFIDAPRVTADAEALLRGDPS